MKLLSLIGSKGSGALEAGSHPRNYNVIQSKLLKNGFCPLAVLSPALGPTVSQNKRKKERNVPLCVCRVLFPPRSETYERFKDKHHGMSSDEAQIQFRCCAFSGQYMKSQIYEDKQFKD